MAGHGPAIHVVHANTIHVDGLPGLDPGITGRP